MQKDITKIGECFGKRGKIEKNKDFIFLFGFYGFC